MDISSPELKVLRCVKCGAPLSEEEKSETEYIKCIFCGYTQKLVDMRDYLDKLRGEIYGWVSTMIPHGVIGSQVVDTMARHNIFIFNIKPKIMGDFISMKAKLSRRLTTPLFILPFFNLSVSQLEDPKKCFENLAKIDTLSPMAMIEEDKSYLEDVAVTYQTYAYINNAYDLIKKNSELSFLIENFDKASSTLEMNPSREIEYKRMNAITEAYRAADAFLNGDPKTSKNLANNAISLLEEVLMDARKSTSTAVMIPATITDISTLRTLENLNTAALKMFESGRAPTEILPYLDGYFKVAEEVRANNGYDLKIYKELSSYLLNIIEAKNATSYVKILSGPGNLLVPLWMVSVTYTFATGKLFWKKGKEMKDTLLVAATVPLSSVSVTDIFNVSSGFMDGLTGKETTLSDGAIDNLVTQAKDSSIASSFKVIPPVSIKEGGERVAEHYLSSVSAKLGGKLNFGIAHSLGLVYANAQIKGNDIYIPALGNAQIKLGSHLERLMKIAL